MRSKLLLLSLFLMSSIGFSQSIDLTGVVKDASTGEPLAGVSILLKSTQNGTISDFDGNFKI